jgi:hypothetical protein
MNSSRRHPNILFARRKLPGLRDRTRAQAAPMDSGSPFQVRSRSTRQECLLRPRPLLPSLNRHLECELREPRRPHRQLNGPGPQIAHRERRDSSSHQAGHKESRNYRELILLGWLQPDSSRCALSPRENRIATTHEMKRLFPEHTFPAISLQCFKKLDEIASKSCFGGVVTHASQTNPTGPVENRQRRHSSETETVVRFSSGIESKRQC